MLKKFLWMLVVIYMITTKGFSQNIYSLESFDYAGTTSLAGQTGGRGWGKPWETTDVSNTYAISLSTPFVYANPTTTSPLYISPGMATGSNTQGLVIGRYLDTTSTGLYKTYIDATGSIRNTSSIQITFMLRKETSDDSQVSFGLSDGLTTDKISQGLSIGYFGSLKSVSGGKKYWTVKYNDTYYLTNRQITTNKNELFILEIYSNAAFTSTTMRFWTDPVIQNGWSATSIFNQALSPFKFKSVFFYGESGAKLDEIRCSCCNSPSPSFVYDPLYHLIGVSGTP